MLELPEQRVAKKVKSLQVFRRPVAACQQVRRLAAMLPPRKQSPFSSGLHGRLPNVASAVHNFPRSLLVGSFTSL